MFQAFSWLVLSALLDKEHAWRHLSQGVPTPGEKKRGRGRESLHVSSEPFYTWRKTSQFPIILLMSSGLVYHSSIVSMMKVKWPLLHVYIHHHAQHVFLFFIDFLNTLKKYSPNEGIAIYRAHHILERQRIAVGGSFYMLRIWVSLIGWQ